MIIFLDIDGVIATRKSYKKKNNYLDRGCIAVLNDLVLITKARIVISSSWRYIHKLDALRVMLQSAGLVGEVIGVTPSAVDVPGRGKQILEWIKQNHYQGDYLVIDDDSFDIVSDIPADKFLQVKDGFANKGLTHDHIRPYIKIHGGGKQ